MKKGFNLSDLRRSLPGEDVSWVDGLVEEGGDPFISPPPLRAPGRNCRRELFPASNLNAQAAEFVPQAQAQQQPEAKVKNATPFWQPKTPTIDEILIYLRGTLIGKDRGMLFQKAQEALDLLNKIKDKLETMAQLFEFHLLSAVSYAGLNKKELVNHHFKTARMYTIYLDEASIELANVKIDLVKEMINFTPQQSIRPQV